MSYIEKAFYSYIRSTMTNGIRILLSKKFLLFSIGLLLLAGASTVGMFLVEQNNPLVTLELLDLIFSIQASAVIALILSGLISKKIKSTIMRFLLLVILLGAITIVIVVAENLDIPGTTITVKSVLADIIPLVAFLSWGIIVPISTFVFVKNLFSSKIMGSILFLGKPKTDKNSLFLGPVFIVSLIFLVLGWILITQGRSLFGSLAIFLSLVMWPVMWGKFVSDDVFTTILCFFFALSIPNILLLTITSSETISTLNLILVLFSLLFAAQGVAKRVKPVLDHENEEDHPDRDDPLGISRFVRFIGGEGLVLMLLGVLLGWHLVELKVLSGSTLTPDLYLSIFGSDSVSDFYKKITIITAGFVLLGSIVLFNFWGQFRIYFSSDLYRFDLPPYEELEDFFRRMKRGEVSWAGFAASLAKKAVMGGVRKIKKTSEEKSVSPIRGILDLIRGGSRKKKRPRT